MSRKTVNGSSARYMRSQLGQMMGVADLVIVLPVTILCFFFLTNAGLSVYYKNRMGGVADEAAVYAAGRLNSADVNLDTQLFVGDLFTKMHVPASNIKCDVEKTTVGGLAALQCTITADFDLIQGSPLPYKISLTEVACTAKSSIAQMAVRAYINGGMHTVYLPLVKRMPGAPTVYNPRFFVTEQGAASFTNSAPDLF